MIIDIHAHYNHNSFKNSFRYLPRDDNGYAICCSDYPSRRKHDDF